METNQQIESQLKML